MNLLTPDPGLLFWMLLSFGVVFFLLAKFGFPVIVKAINERKEFIEMSLLSAKQANEKLANIQAESDKLLADTKAQQKEIIAGAMQEKQKIVQAAQDEAQVSANQIIEDAKQSIQVEKERALQDVRKEIATLALDIAEKVIGERMKDDAQQRKTIEQLIMMNGSIAKRYATALFEEAQAQFVDRQVYDHLGMLHRSMKAEPNLQMALINPRVTKEKKYALILLASGLDPEATTLTRGSSACC